VAELILCVFQAWNGKNLVNFRPRCCLSEAITYYDRYSGDHDKAKQLRNKAALSKCTQVECARQAAKK
jgi:hypothetical protein